MLVVQYSVLCRLGAVCPVSHLRRSQVCGECHACCRDERSGSAAPPQGVRFVPPPPPPPPLPPPSLLLVAACACCCVVSCTKSPYIARKAPPPPPPGGAPMPPVAADGFNRWGINPAAAIKRAGGGGGGGGPGQKRSRHEGRMQHAWPLGVLRAWHRAEGSYGACGTGMPKEAMARYTA